jgi:hypothetical protein
MNNQGQVIDTEVSAASDRVLMDSGPAAAKQLQMPGSNDLTIRFSPQAE